MREIEKVSGNLSLEERVHPIEEKDVCFTKKYASLYEEKENGTAEVFDFVSPYGKVKNIFLKRTLPFPVDDQDYYDIATPYGYGGPMIVETTHTERLLQEYFEAFHQYCREQNIVSEFVRFHLLENQEVREQFAGATQMIGQHIVRDLKEPLEQDFHKGVLQAVRRAERLGVEVVFDREGCYLDQFLDIYHTTMDLHEASDFYFFDRTFFEQIHETMEGHFLYIHAMLDGKAIASRLVLFGDTYAYYFLGGAFREYSTYKAAVLLDYKIVEYLQKEGAAFYIFGGGYRGEDSLYKYKSKFSQHGQIPFYIGKKIHHPEVYRRLEAIRMQKGNFDPTTSFFPSYRS